MGHREGQLSLNSFIYLTGHHEGAWRHPNARPDQIYDVTYYQSLARLSEEAKFDAIFLADGPVLGENPHYNVAGGLEPLTLLTAIAQATRDIGLIATISTTYYDPYNVARLFSSLDHISRGRAALNAVTTGTPAAAYNFGAAGRGAQDERYERAGEFIDVLLRLWGSWESDAIQLDTSRGVYADPSKIRQIDHHGRFFDVRGPLNLARSPQGRPLIVQSGSSPEGRDLAARVAEIVFTAQLSLQDAQTFYADLKGRLARFGRSAQDLKILPGISPVIGGTEQEARRLADELNELTVPAYGIGQVRKITGVDLDGYDFDEPVPLDLFGDDAAVVDSTLSRRIAEIVWRDKPTVRGLLHQIAGARGHYSLVGTPEQVAAVIEQWFDSYAADGFNVMPPLLPDGLEAFIDGVLPILRQRGLFREEYDGHTLRDHYALGADDDRRAVASAQ